MIEKIMKKIYGPAVNLCCDFLMLEAKCHKGRTPYNAEELKLLPSALLFQNLFSIEGTMIPVF